MGWGRGGGHVDTEAVDDGAIGADGVFGDALGDGVVGEGREVHIGRGVEGKGGVVVVVRVHRVWGGERKVGGRRVGVHEPGLAAHSISAAETGSETVVGVSAWDEDGLGACGGWRGGAADAVAAACAGGTRSRGRTRPGARTRRRVPVERKGMRLVAHRRGEWLVGLERDVKDVVGAARRISGQRGHVVVKVVWGSKLAKGIESAVHVFRKERHW